MLISHQPSWAFSPQETASITYSKGYWVLNIVMHNLKGSLPAHNGLERQHILNTKIGLIYHLGRNPYRRNDRPIKVNRELGAAKEFREWQQAFM